MNIYRIQNGVLVYCKPGAFSLEKQMQTLIENNLQEISELEVVKSEFIIKNKRIDTLAFNSRLKAFVIIEYKREKNYSVIDQGIAYLKFMLENKADFLLEFNEKKCSSLTRKEINWKNSYIIFAAPKFTEHQKNAASYKDLRIILWVVKLYGDSILAISEIINNTHSDDDFQHSKQIPETGKTQSWQTDTLWNEIKIIGKRN